MSTPSSPATGPATEGPEDWRGVATEDTDELSTGAGIFVRARSRRLLGELLAPHRRALWALLATITAQNLAWLAGPFLIGLGIDVAVPALLDGDPWPLVWITAAMVGAAVLDTVLRFVFLTRSGRVGQAVLLDPAAAGVHPRPAAAAVLPRALHVGQDDQPADQRRRGARRAARRGPGQPGDGAVQRPHDRRRPGRARPAARRRRPARLPRAVLAGPLVPAQLDGGLPAHPADDRRPDRAVHRDLRRHPGGAGVPPRAAQRRAARGAERGQPAGPPPGVLADGGVRPRGHADRQPGHRRGARLRRAAGDGRRPRRRRPRVVPALPAPVLRPAAGRRDVLQQLPVGGRGAGEAVRRPRGAAGRRRADRPGARCRTRAASWPSTASASATPAAPCCRTWTCGSPPGRPWRWSGATGAGKSTLARLAARFYDPLEGEVRLDGVPAAPADRRRPAPRGGDGDPGELPVLRDRSPTTSPSAGRARRGREIEARRPGDRRARVHRRAAGGLRHRRPPARRAAVGRSAAAGELRPRLPGRPGGADPRRGDELARRPERAAGAARAADAARRADGADHRPPAVHGGDRRPGAGDGGRPDRRGRHPRPSWSAASAGSPTCTGRGPTAWSEPASRELSARWERRTVP